MEPNLEFNGHLEKLYSLFHSRADTITLYIKEVEKICTDALAASNIRHTPIASRVKSWKSAKGSLRRRYDERLIHQSLRKAVEAKGRTWESYCLETGLNTYHEDMEPFQKPEDMIEALHDFGGIRISLYFPGDLEKVAEIINNNFTVIRRVEKGDKAPVNTQGLRERLALLQSPGVSEDTTAGSEVLARSMRTFTGYKATHFIVKLRDEYIPPGKSNPWQDVVIEIQVGTLVMHVWSEIEHDMIYKPLDSQGERVSEDEQRILDLINGIVLTGEAALRQLEASTSNRMNERARNAELEASSHYELATWIEKDCQTRGIELEDGEWRYLDQLFTLLKVTGKRKHREVTKLIEEAVQHSSRRHFLPTKMLIALSNGSRCAQWIPSNGEPDILSIVKNARLWAFRLIHGLNFAIYFGVAREILEMENLPERPSITSFLDILHPFRPRYSGAESAQRIAKFCKAIVELKPKREGKSSEVLDICMNLPVKDANVAILAGSGKSGFVPIPGIISQIFPSEEGLDYVDYTNQLYPTLDIIDFYLSHNNAKDDKLRIWDGLTARASDTQLKRSVEDRFFAPEQMTGNEAISRWQLCAKRIPLAPLNVQKIDPEDVHKTVVPEQRNAGISGPSSPHGSHENILNLAYHLYPEEEWDNVRRAWTVVKNLNFDLRPRVNRSSSIEKRRSDEPSPASMNHKRPESDPKSEQASSSRDIGRQRNSASRARRVPRSKTVHES